MVLLFVIAAVIMGTRLRELLIAHKFVFAIFLENMGKLGDEK